jgi:hypothetical protein
MHRLLTASSLFAPLAMVVLLTGCPPCEQLCVAQGEVYAECLGEWGLTWANTGYAGTEDYEEVCKDEAELATGRQDAAEKREANQACAELNGDLRSSEDCDELYDLLVAY